METKDFMELTKQAKNSNEKLLELLHRLQPLINAYTNKLFFLDKDDGRQEIILAIIESVKSIPSYQSDGECIAYIHNAVKFKYARLCKKNIKRTDIEDEFRDENTIENVVSKEKYSDIETYIDFNSIIEDFPKSKQKIFKYILLGYSDSEIADIIGCSRQYINRIKKKIEI